MSRTDKDRPFWVKNAETGMIEHDHRNGECIEETLEYTKWSNGSYRSHSHSFKLCNKHWQETFTCTKRDPYLGNSTRYNRRQECWVERCRCTANRYFRHIFRWGRTWNKQNEDCPTWGRVQCEGHTEWRHDRSISCVCDTWPDRPTCTIDGQYYWGGVPTEFVRAVYHRPERHKAAQAMNDVRRQYNSGEDIEDFDYFSRQARNSARWLWW